MTQQRHASVRDVTATQRSAGLGCAPMFLCGCCSRKRATTGRKLARVLGLRTWVCVDCAEGKK